MRYAETRLTGSVEASFKAFDKSLNKLQLQNKKIIHYSAKATIDVFYDKGCFYDPEITDQILK